MGYLIFITSLIIYYEFRLHKLYKSNTKNIKEARKDAVKRQRSTIKGQIIEQVAPWLSAFDCEIEDLRFIGSPIDYIAFTGLDSDKATVKFYEVKTGQGKLTSRERRLRDAINSGRVEWTLIQDPHLNESPQN